MPQIVPQPSLRGLGSLVSMEQISSLMTARSSTLVTDHEDLVEQIVRGVSAEVTALVGRRFVETADPESLDLAVWCITLGAAANLELSLFPEQQLGDDSRANVLRGQYLGVRADLVSTVSSGGSASGIEGGFTIRTRAQPFVAGPASDACRGAW